MGKLMRVTRGRAYLVAVDIRKRSPTVGEWFGIELSEDSPQQVWAPAGFARGLCALTEGTEVQYKCTAIYNPASESRIRWNDPALSITWPVMNPVLSDLDAQAQTLTEWLASPGAEALAWSDPRQ